MNFGANIYEWPNRKCIWRNSMLTLKSDNWKLLLGCLYLICLLGIISVYTKSKFIGKSFYLPAKSDPLWPAWPIQTYTHLLFDSYYLLRWFFELSQSYYLVCDAEKWIERIFSSWILQIGYGSMLWWRS